MRKQGSETQAEVLDVLRSRGKPMTAYEILEALRGTREKMAAPTIYRALAALTGDGRAHRIESTNSYMPCCHEGHDEAAVLAICGDCGSVEEQVDPSLTSRIDGLAESRGFRAQRHVIELHGTCGDCQDKAAT